VSSETKEDKGRIARVTKVIKDQSPYAVAKAVGLDSEVTFSLASHLKVWKEDETPSVGTRVILSDIRKNDNGWRAHTARFLRPEDEDQTVNKAT
jgi:hypothetical protein